MIRQDEADREREDRLLAAGCWLAAYAVMMIRVGLQAILQLA